MKAAIISDKELIGKYLSGNEKSLEKLILRHKRKVYAYILMVVKTISWLMIFSRTPLSK